MIPFPHPQLAAIVAREAGIWVVAHPFNCKYTFAQFEDTLRHIREMLSPAEMDSLWKVYCDTIENTRKAMIFVASKRYSFDSAALRTEEDFV